MEETENKKNRRIAKNTLALYVRMLFLLLISLYTSRVILQMLGVEDFGIYNVVGSFVALLAVVSRSLSSSSSRFFNYEMGKGQQDRLSKVFSTTLSIQIFLAIVITILIEIAGLWFVNNKMIVSEDRLYAANWAFQFSVLTFCTHLFIIPYQAAIIAHERMNYFAYIGIFEGVSKLAICYLLLVSSIDRLILFSFLMFIIQLCLLALNKHFCKKNFAECSYHFTYDKIMLKEIFSFASWNMIGSTAAILRNQGGNILINLFFGPVVNAARAIANQVLHAVSGFVENFVIALKPQITISYANKNWNYMMRLVFQGSRLSYYMLLLLCLPILFNTDILLNIWLKTVPIHTVKFVQLTIIFTMVESLSHTLITAQAATGRIRNYQIVVGSLMLLNLPLSYIILKIGGTPETILYVAIFIAICCLVARLIMLQNAIVFNIRLYGKKVIINVLAVTISAIFLPLIIKVNMPQSYLSLFFLSLVCILSSTLSILYIGCKEKERAFVYSKIANIVNHLRRH